MDTLHCLAMLDVEHQVPKRGSMSAAYLQVASTGVIDATCRLYVLVQQLFLTRNIDPGTGPALACLVPEALAEKLQSQLAALPELRDPGHSLEEQHNTLSLFQDAHANLPSDVNREVAVRAKSVLGEAIERVRLGLAAVYASAAPSAVQGLIATVRDSVNRTRVPDPNRKPLARWADLTKTGDKVGQRRRLLPPSAVKTIFEGLATECRNLYSLALKELAIEKIGVGWPMAKAALIGYLGDLGKWSSEVVASLAAVKKALESTRAAVAADQQVSRASVVKCLPGSTESQVIAGMLTQLQATDEMELARMLLASWETKLREIRPQVCPWIDGNAPFPDLLRGMPAAVQAAHFREVVEEAQGPGQTLYEFLKREGLRECAEFLYHRSEPTVHLAGRDMAQLGLTPQTFCIVTLPKPIGPNDAAIQADLVAAFEETDSDCTFAEAAPTDRTVTAIRILDGFVIGIEGQTPNLLNHYQYAALQGHLPHLFDLLPESPEGTAIPDYLSLNK